MEELFSKTFDVYRIVEHYDYSDIPEVKNSEELDEIFGLNPLMHYSPVPLYSTWKEKSISKTKEDFEKNTKNVLARLQHQRFSVFVVKNDEKVTLKYFNYSLSKRPGEKFFRKSTQCNYLSYNIKKNVVYVGSITNYHKKRKFSKSVRCVDFSTNVILNKVVNIDNHYSFLVKESPENLVNLSIGKDAVEVFLKNIPGISYSLIPNSTFCLHKTIMEKKGIKLSDNWWAFSEKFPQPKSKDFKKFGNKYLDVIMGINGLSGDKIKRVLHTVKNFNPTAFNEAVTFFGKDFIISQPDQILKNIFESNLNLMGLYFGSINSKKERINIFEIYKLVLKGEIHQSTFSDHLNFLNRIKKFENIKWLSNNYDEFREEHLNWTELVDFYTKGSFKRIYNEVFITFVSQPINDGDNELTPVILTDSNEYNTESFVQSNCVKGYIQRAPSMIISLRRNEKERATIEYRITKKYGIEIDRVQTLGRFNYPLDSSWDKSIELLDNRIKEALKQELFTTPKIKCKIGYTEFESDSHFTDDFSGIIPVNYDTTNRKLTQVSYLSWDDKNVENHMYSGTQIMGLI